MGCVYRILTAHEVEANVWERVLAIGHQALALFFSLQGSGDLGDSLPLPNGATAYVTDPFDGIVTPINLATALPGTPITVMDVAGAIAIT